jgi:hypothetical protein
MTLFTVNMHICMTGRHPEHSLHFNVHKHVVLGCVT